LRLHRVEKKLRWPLSLPVTLALVFVAVLGYSAYLWTLYQQLDRAFHHQEEFIPTRIYSDVSRIAPPQLKVRVLERLKSLSYSLDGSDSGDTLSFTLHTPDYPEYLIPDQHPVLAPAPSGGSKVTLFFDGAQPGASLKSVRLNGQDIPDLYLEPEIVATLSRGPKEVRELVHFDDVPSTVWKALIAVEDQHFLEHKGLDPRGIARALWFDLRTHSLAQGGSTITLQLVKNLMVRRGRNIFKKLSEIPLAFILETKYSKEEILERYLNEVYLGQIGSLEIHGVSEGAKYFFGRSLDDLNLAEITLMVGQVRGTGYYSPYYHQDRAMQRGKLVLHKMVETGMIAQQEEQTALKMPIRLAPAVTVLNKAPFFTDFVKAELYRQLKDRMSEEEINQAGFRVYTTLDPELSRIAQTSVSEGIAFLEKGLKIDSTAHPEEKLEGALASVDQSTGFIRALVGGRSYAQSNFNRILNMKRQVGSTFKPVVYLSAFIKGQDGNGVPYSPAHPAEDGPWTLVYDNGRQTWAPKNYEKDFLGWTNFRTALAHSKNTVAAKLGIEVGIPSIIQTARALSITADLPAVPSISLGIAELTPVELLRAYAILGNHGIQDELTVIRAITHSDLKSYARFIYNPKQVIEAGPVDLLTSMLQSVFLDGTAKDAHRMGFDRFAAGKTGTTSNHRDAWFAGYTPQLTTVVWVGADQNPNLTEKTAKQKGSRIALTGATSALPIWVDYMKHGLDGEPTVAFPISPDLQEVPVDTHTGMAARPDCRPTQVLTDKFMKTHLPRVQTCEPNWPPPTTETVVH
jgi:penicillin-binding protein 1B